MRSFAYCRSSGEFQETGLELNVSESLRQISAAGAQWAELLTMQWENAPFNSGHCPECEFNFFCNKYRKPQNDEVIL